MLEYPTAPRLPSAARLAVLALALAGCSAWQPRIDADSMLDVSVSIRTVSRVHTDPLGDSVWESGAGSGFLVSRATCEVWTNHHVVADAALIEVFPRGWRAAAGIAAAVLGSTPRSDLAVLRMERCTGIPEARLGDSDALRPGDEVYAVGNPLGRNPDSISRGVVSHTARYLGTPIPYLQTDAAINPGSSGGALFDRHGRVVGITSAIATPGKGSVGIGYAVPINLARAIVARLREAAPSWGEAGFEALVSPLSPDEAELFGVPDGAAAVILTGEPTGPPAAGSLHARDVIYAIDGEPLVTPEEAMRRLAGYPAGARVGLDLVRGGARHRVVVVLREGWRPPAAGRAQPYPGHLGMALEMWPVAEDGRPAFAHPVITRVYEGGPAHRAHIASSQHGAIARGPFLVAFQLDVKTVTGVVLGGVYHPVGDPGSLEGYARQAAASGAPLLLEIELWARADPLDLDAELERVGTAYFRVEPRASPRLREAATGPRETGGTDQIEVRSR